MEWNLLSFYSEVEVDELVIGQLSIAITVTQSHETFSLVCWKTETGLQDCMCFSVCDETVPITVIMREVLGDLGPVGKAKERWQYMYFIYEYFRTYKMTKNISFGDNKNRIAGGLGWYMTSVK